MFVIKSLNVDEARIEKTSYSNYTYSFTLHFEHFDPDAITLYLQNHWYQTISIAIIYYILIQMLQWYMMDRKPFALRIPLIIWNSMLAIFSISGLVRIAEELFYNLHTHGFNFTVCHTVNVHGVAAFWLYMFFLSKIVELVDTLFIVLRKRKLIFLHYYHHAVVLVYTAHAGATLTAGGVWFAMMNLLAHSCMYTYYATKACGLDVPRKVAIMVTTIQTSQMLCGVAITAYMYKLKTYDGIRCQTHLPNLHMAFFLYMTFAVLFIQFFFKAYVVRKNRRDTCMTHTNLKAE